MNGGAAAVAKTFLGTQAGVALEGFEGDNNQSDLMRRKLQVRKGLLVSQYHTNTLLF